MAVKSSGANANLSFGTDIVGEFGGTAPHNISEYKRGGSLVPNGPSANVNIPTTNADIQFSDFFGAVNAVQITYEIIGGGGEGAGGYTGDGPGNDGGTSTLYGSGFTTVTSAGGAGGTQPAPFNGSFRTSEAGEASYYGSGGAGGANSDSNNQTPGYAAPSTSYGAGGGGGGAHPFSANNGGGGGKAATRQTGTVNVIPSVNFFVIIGAGGTGIGGGGDGAGGYAKLTIGSNVYEYTSSGVYTLSTNGSTITQVSYSSSPAELEITVSDKISSGGTYTIPSGYYIYSDNTSVAALTIDIPCTIVNNGYIMGRGGNGGSFGGAGGAGGPAIKINSGVTGVTITNNSGAYIAGGGGGGGGGFDNSSAKAGGGGGAGGGIGGSSGDVAGGSGGGVGASGGDASGASWASGGTGAPNALYLGGNGGGSGGEGGYYNSDGARVGGGGGGRVLPGVGGTGGLSYNGGSANSAGGGGSADNRYGAGGGGWGAAGGTASSSAGSTGSGGAAGKAIEDSGVTYTLTDNGTIYGAT